MKTFLENDGQSAFKFIIAAICMYILSLVSVLQKWPTSDGLKCFREIHTSFFQRCKELSLRILRVMAISLGLDPDVFLRAHLLMGSMITVMTLLHLGQGWSKTKL